jgi:predicted ATP-dependent endonuclease of OLD family
MVFNHSINVVHGMAGAGSKQNKEDFSINEKLAEYEKTIFKFDKNVEKLLNNKINYNAILPLIDENDVQNLKWLKTLANEENQEKARAKFGLKFPIEKVIIAEGITEEILLPKFAQICGYDFDKMGVNLISAGGKNQVVKLFYQFADILKLPIFVLLDIDAKENYDEILPKLRDFDKVHVLESGEFEDTLPLNLIKRAVNKHPKIFIPISVEDLKKEMPMTKTLEELFSQRGIEFKKAEFAALVGENITSTKDVSQEILEVIKELDIFGQIHTALR